MSLFIFSDQTILHFYVATKYNVFLRMNGRKPTTLITLAVCFGTPLRFATNVVYRASLNQNIWYNILRLLNG